ncbi:hypothetical protein ACE193_19000 [Bernardetia sp. OM2101]|uniref:hypothetical protein n=1 Tax=Bernardetia sp. OM2101 TaxID=3344876 RepID=UPI0035D11CCB
MPQNLNTSKFSSFIGFLLLIGIIGFTIFINFFDEEQIKNITQVEEEKIYFEPFDSTDLVNFWKLEKLQTKTATHQALKKTYIFIDKNFGIVNYNPSKDIFYDEIPDSVKQYFKKSYTNNSDKEFIINYGTLEFNNSYDSDNTITFEEVEIKKLNKTSADSAKLLEIGSLFLEYQINSIVTSPEYGDFTSIYLKDRRQLFLIKEGTEVKGDFYQKLLEKAEYLNDSTRIVVPSKKLHFLR